MKTKRKHKLESFLKTRFKSAKFTKEILNFSKAIPNRVPLKMFMVSYNLEIIFT